MADASPAGSLEQKLTEQRREKLKPLLHDVEISRAVEADRPGALYRLLQRKRKQAGIVERPVMDELLSSRRLFSEPVKKAPTMYTLNGCGTSLYGKAEADAAEGTHIATLFIVFVFLPIFPLAAYLVAPAEGRAWYFLRRVPLNQKMRRWRQLTAAGLVAAAVLVAGMAYHAQTYSTLRVANGLDVPVAVQLDQAAPVTVGPRKIRALDNVRKGKHHLATRSTTGQLVEEFDVEVPLAKDVIAYNVLGAAPLFAEGIIYYANGQAPATARTEKPPFQHYCGERFIVRNDVRYVFAEPEQNIKMSTGREVRWRFDVDLGGWQKTVNVLQNERRLDAAAALAAAVARLEPDNENAVALGIAFIAATRSNAAAEAFARELIGQFPSALPAHRGLQNLLAAQGRQAECRAEYRQLHAAHPDSIGYGYLHARTEPAAESVKLYAALAARAPSDPYICRGHAYTLFQLRRFAEAVPQFERFAALEPDSRDVLLEYHARALVAVGRTNDAVRLVADVCDQHASRSELAMPLVLLYGRLAALAPAVAGPRPVTRYLHQLFGQDPLSPSSALWYAMENAPHQITDAQLAAETNQPGRVIATIARAAATGQAVEALKLAGQVEPLQLGRLPDATLVILAGQAVAAGNAALATNLLAGLDRQRPGLPALKEAVLTGKDSPELEELDLELRAALSAVRGQRDRALADDILPGPVTFAVQAAPR
jgi:tetratricopeptide (TPR) repeat protein